MVQCNYPSPVGELCLTVESARLVGLEFFAEDEKPVQQLHTASADARQTMQVLDAARRQLDAFFASRLKAFHLPIALKGTPFQLRVWAELAKIPFGQTISYRELADRTGNPKASRAVGSANGANPLAIIVPCHRVIAADGSLAGFAGGVAVKRALLEHEGARAGLFALASG